MVFNHHKCKDYPIFNDTDADSASWDDWVCKEMLNWLADLKCAYAMDLTPGRIVAHVATNGFLPSRISDYQEIFFALLHNMFQGNKLFRRCFKTVNRTLPLYATVLWDLLYRIGNPRDHQLANELQG